MKKIVILGITSGIAAYKMPDLVTMLQKDGIDVHVVMTDAASKMVDVKAFESASGNKVMTRLFEDGFDYRDILKLRKVEHIDLADRADVICIAPATANVIAKMAHGIADDFLTTMVLASNSPVILSPSMNVHMWNNPVTQESIDSLRKRGFIVIPPERGPLACGYEGPGRLPHLEKIRGEIVRQMAKSRALSAKRIVVTAGATIEKIDDVRFITNKSSGKMGAAIADACHLRGSEVVLLRARNAVEPRYVYKTEAFETVEELELLLKRYAQTADVVFHAAAVGDFVVTKTTGKSSSKQSQSLHLSPQKKVSDSIKQWNPRVLLVVFKAEWNLSEADLIKRAKEKLKESNADFVIANDVGKSDRGFQVDTNEVVVVSKNGASKHFPLATKQEIAEEIVSHLF